MPTPPTISWSELAGRAVGVWGLGVEGRANLAKLEALGVAPILVDDQAPEGGIDGRPVLATAAGGLDALARCGIRLVHLEVEEGNAPALALYRRLGFEEVGRREGYYRKQDGSRVAALTMLKRL